MVKKRLRGAMIGGGNGSLIETHVENLCRSITRRSIQRLSAGTHTFLPVNELDDDMTVLAVGLVSVAERR